MAHWACLSIADVPSFAVLLIGIEKLCRETAMNPIGDFAKSDESV
jgi:hypothetical protein